MTPMHREEFGAIRRRIGWTQEEFATFFDVTVRTVQRWESGAGDIPQPVAMMLRLIAAGKISNADIRETAMKVADYAFA